VLFQTPDTAEEWLQISKEFETKWNFPNCIGALDGKHVEITPPVNSGSDYYNYKNTFSVVLLAMVDANYKFIYVDIGTNGRISDGGVYGKSSLAEALHNNSLNIPTDRPLPGRNKPQPFVIIADEAFPLKANIMKPYSGRNAVSKERRIYNYRTSRARRIVENAFGILSNRFRIFLSPINLRPETVQLIVLASCALHNFLRDQVSANSDEDLVDTEDVATGVTVPGSWRQLVCNGSWSRLAADNSRRSTEYASEVREEFCAFFNNEGRVPWQDSMLEHC
jgi:hypothetical protein